MAISGGQTQPVASTSRSVSLPCHRPRAEYIGPDPSRVILCEGGTPRTPIFQVHAGSDLSQQWTKYVHINGSVYFYNHALRIITEDDMEFDERARKKVLRLRREMLWEVSQLQGDSVPQDAEMIVRLGSCEEEHLVWFMSHRTTEYIAVAEEGIRIESNTSRYWTHVEEYPMHFSRLPSCARVHFLASMTYGANNTILENRRNKFPYLDAQIERLMRIYDDLSDACLTNPAMLPILTWHIARTLRRIEAAHQRYRIAHPSLPGYFGFALQYTRQELPRSSLKAWGVVSTQWILAIMLFGSFMTYWRRLDQVREGISVDLEGFRGMLREFLVEWSDSNLLATVLIGANVTFLSISSISSFQRTASLVSTVFAVLSIIVGLYHVWHHRTKVNVDIIEACKYMSHTRHYDDRTDDSTDLLIMASFLCVPVASLFWSLGSFAVAIAAYCIQNTDREGEALLSAILGVALIVGVASIMILTRSWKLR